MGTNPNIRPNPTISTDSKNTCNNTDAIQVHLKEKLIDDINLRNKIEEQLLEQPYEHKAVECYSIRVSDSELSTTQPEEKLRVGDKEKRLLYQSLTRANSSKYEYQQKKTNGGKTRIKENVSMSQAKVNKLKHFRVRIDND